MVHVVLRWLNFSPVHLDPRSVSYFCGLVEDLLLTETYTCCFVLCRDVSPHKLVMPLIRWEHSEINICKTGLFETAIYIAHPL